ncbi:MAG: DUF1573 domain-containing protein [Bacteroidales bacterium]|nr:DUF1573 domain-containing protein [Bacteroidales bacterium]
MALILLTTNSLAQSETDKQRRSFSIGNILKKQRKGTITKDTQNVKKEDTPIISIDKLFFDYGDVLQSQRAVATFEITNIGNADLRIDSIEIACGCLDVNVVSNVVKPKRTTIMSVKYNTNIVGEIRHSVTIICNDTFNRRVTLLLTGNVVLNDIK